MELYKIKQKLRKDIALQKKEYTKDTLSNLSEKILGRLENMAVFLQSSCIALYHAIPGEVQTACFIERWKDKKTIFLPVIKGDDLIFIPYTQGDQLISNSFGILEPNIQNREELDSKIDLMIVPGIAFDRSLNRMGRGRGYYDRFLKNQAITKVGICFDFQLLEEIPTEYFDVKMDAILTEKEVIS